MLPSGTVAAEGLVAWFRSESGGAKDGSDGILDCDMGHYRNGQQINGVTGVITSISGVMGPYL